MNRRPRSVTPITAAILVSLCGTCSINTADRPLSGRYVLRFDPGPFRSAVEDQATELFLDSIYTPETGFGWVQPPRSDFRRDELSRSRSALTIDGVSGSRIGFRADVESGAWYVTLWLEAAQTDGHLPRIIVQGQRQTPRWQFFRPRAEPDRSLPKEYRVFHCSTNVGSSGLSIDLTGGQEKPRLLGLSLIRQVPDVDGEHQSFLQQVEAASHYRGNNSLDPLLEQAEASLRENPTDAFHAIWRERLQLLATAERYYSLRGWRSSDEQVGIGMSDRHRQALLLLDGLLMADPAETKPLADRALFLRGRLLYWLAKERFGADELAGGKRDLEVLAERHPEDELLAMYTGKQVDSPDACDGLESAAAAPPWSIAQREALCRMRQLAHWWVEQRQSDSGELGGKLGDDVEMLRWWAPLCLTGDETALRGWKKLADGAWRSERIYAGYSRKVADVEHAAEFLADTAPLMLLYSDEPNYAKRLTYSAKHFESLWTGVTVNGNRHFRSAWFSSTEVEADEPKGRDLEYNTRAAQAMRYLAWRHRQPKVVELLHQWSTAWVNAAMRTDKGKPAGIIPASVRFADEAINGDGPNWHQANMFWDYYDWQHYAGSLLLDQLLFTHTLTKDDQLLQPMFKSLELVRSEESGLSESARNARQEGSPAWAAEKLMSCELFWNVVEQWRFLTNDPRWDDLILRHGTAYGRYRISGDERHLVDGLNRLLEDVRYNTPLKTTEALYTDRVTVPDAELLKAMLTGDGIENNLSPYYAVSWQQTDENFTALVTDANQARLQAQLFSHGPEDCPVVMRVWQLTPGEYQLLCEAQAEPPHKKPITISEPGQRIPLTLPSRRLLRVSLQRAP